MIILSSTYAQVDTVILYPNGVPGLKGKQIPEDSQISGGITRVKDITQPALIVYIPKVKTSDATVFI